MREASFTLQRSNERGLLSTDKSTCTLEDADIEGEVGVEDMLAQKTFLPTHVERLADADDGLGIFGTDVEDALGCTNGIGGNHHALDDSQGIGLQEDAIHESTWVTLVTIADDDGGRGEG